jgi:crotonobetainyl-CoA:carnitine CoA-transferase CaiB-like acyl-CoA transferase
MRREAEKEISAMSGPLTGFKVIDLTSMVSGPLATMVLADQGADVIKVENPRGGDYTRSVATRRGGFSASFLNNNRNKRSVALDLKDPRGRELLDRLVAGADVFVQNFRPGVAERMGIGEDAIRQAAPDIVYVSISGFGERGPYAGKPVYDPLVQALSGLTTVQGGSDSVRPRLIRTVLPDKLTGFTAAQAITSALLARERSGEGQHVRLSMLDTIMAFLWSSDMGGQTFVGDETAEEEAQSFIDLIYETADGYISVAVQSDKEWAGLAAALDKPEWLDDPRFKTAASRHENIDARLGLTQDVLLTRTADEWLARLEDADVPCAPVLRRRDVVDHPQIAANETVVESDHPQAGRLRQARPAPRFSKTPPAHRHGAPALGQDTRDVLREAGLSEDEIAALAADAIVTLHDANGEAH